MSLRERAAAVAAGETREPGTAPERPTIVAEPLQDVTYNGEITDAVKVPVHVAFNRVMADVQSIAKSDRRDDVGGHYSFRGVDRVVNAVGPALRRHGVLVLPSKILELEYREARTSKGNVMQDCTITVQWTVIGPAGDVLPVPLESAGQATDTQDKATSKATSVAQRVLFLSGLHIPTNEPDTDRGHERGVAAGPSPNEYRDQIVDPRTSLGRLRQIMTELKQHRLGGAVVVNEHGDDEELADLYTRVVAERRSEAGQ